MASTSSLALVHTREMTMSKTLLTVCATTALAVGIGCGQSKVDDPQTRVASQLAATPVVAGYAHALSRSRFAIGTNQTAKTEFGLNKTIGSNGVFATLSATGWTMGIPNG